MKRRRSRIAGAVTLGVTALLAAGSSDAPADSRGDISLVEVTTEQGLWDPLLGMFGHSSIAGDVNGDGWTDLVVGTFTDKGAAQYLERGATGPSPDRLMLGGPDGFTVDPSFPEMFARTSGGAFADLDNDGDQDLVMARNAVIRAVPRPTDPPSQLEPSLILRNDGGHLTVAQEWYRGREAGRPMRQVGVLDYDGDGLLDLYFVDDTRDTGHSALLRNTGNLQFEDVTATSGLPVEGVAGLSVATSDLNEDGLPDLLVSGSHRPFRDDPGFEDPQTARLFINRGGQFEEVDSSVFRMRSYLWNDESGGIAVGDLNRDGLPDLAIGQHVAATPASNPAMAAGQPIRVYLHRGVDDDGVPSFEDVTAAAGVGPVHTRVPHVEIADVDNDGRPDILGGVSVGDGTKPAVFRNLGVDHEGVPRLENPVGLAPEERTPPPEVSGWEELGLDRYWATGSTLDFDRDGRLDWFLVEWFPELPSRLFRNETARPGREHWLAVDVRPQLYAVGAVVEAYIPGRGGDRRHLIASDYVVASTGFAGGIALSARLGLGAHRVVDLRVRLPHGKGVCKLRRVRTDRELQIDADDCTTAAVAP